MGAKALSANAYKRSVGFRHELAGCVLLQAAVVSLFGTAPAGATQVYKWVDERGVTQFSETPPEGKEKVQTLTIEVPEPATVLPTPEQAQSQVLRRSSGPESLQLPGSGESEFFSSSSGWTIDFEKQGRTVTLSQNLFLTVKQGVPSGIFLEVHFENPETGGVDIVAADRFGAEKRIVVTSPARMGITCRPYEIVVHVYRGRSKAFPLGVHRQVIVSQIDTRELKTGREYLIAASRNARSGRCESAETLRKAGVERPRAMSLATYNRIREGMTEHELLEVAGPPHVVRGRSWDDKVFVYHGTAYNDYKSRVEIRNGLVVNKTRTR